MPSETYLLFRTAILGEKQVTCVYDGLYRELCPHIIGHKGGSEQMLGFQFAGQSSRPLPRDGAWKCLALSKVRNAVIRDGDWHTASDHGSDQSCIDDVDLDVNVHVRRWPRA